MRLKQGQLRVQMRELTRLVAVAVATAVAITVAVGHGWGFTCLLTGLSGSHVLLTSTCRTELGACAL